MEKEVLSVQAFLQNKNLAISPTFPLFSTHITGALGQALPISCWHLGPSYYVSCPSPFSVFQKLSCSLLCWGLSFQWEHPPLPFPPGKIPFHPSRTSSNVPSSMNTPTPPKWNYTLHSSRPAAIITFLILFVIFFLYVSPSWTMNSSREFILPDTQ